jgi:hypothetical protein
METKKNKQSLVFFFDLSSLNKQAHMSSSFHTRIRVSQTPDAAGPIVTAAAAADAPSSSDPMVDEPIVDQPSVVDEQPSTAEETLTYEQLVSGLVDQDDLHYTPDPLTGDLICSCDSTTISATMDSRLECVQPRRECSWTVAQTVTPTDAVVYMGDQQEVQFDVAYTKDCCFSSPEDTILFYNSSIGQKAYSAKTYVPFPSSSYAGHSVTAYGILASGSPTQLYNTLGGADLNGLGLLIDSPQHEITSAGAIQLDLTQLNRKAGTDIVLSLASVQEGQQYRIFTSASPFATVPATPLPVTPIINGQAVSGDPLTLEQTITDADLTGMNYLAISGGQIGNILLASLRYTLCIDIDPTSTPSKTTLCGTITVRNNGLKPTKNLTFSAIRIYAMPYGGVGDAAEQVILNPLNLANQPLAQSKPILQPGQSFPYVFKCVDLLSSLDSTTSFRVQADVGITNYTAHTGVLYKMTPTQSGVVRPATCSPSTLPPLNDCVKIVNTLLTNTQLEAILGFSSTVCASGSYSFTQWITTNSTDTVYSLENCVSLVDPSTTNVNLAAPKYATATVHAVPLLVTKTVNKTFTRTYTWDIVKTTTTSSPLSLALNDTTTIPYEIVVTASPHDSNWKVTGNVLVDVGGSLYVPLYNALITQVVDTVTSPAVSQTLSPLAYTSLDPSWNGPNAIGSYDISLTISDSSKTFHNEATVTMQNQKRHVDGSLENDIGTTSFKVSPSIEFTFTSPTTIVGGSALLNDAGIDIVNQSISAESAVAGVLLEPSKTYYATVCGDNIVSNTATLDPDGPQSLITSTASVTINVPCCDAVSDTILFYNSHIAAGAYTGDTTFTSSTYTGHSVVAHGMISTSPGSASALYNKLSGTDETGLGLALESDKEISKSYAIQLDLQNLNRKPGTDIYLSIGSVQPNEGYRIFAQNTAFAGSALPATTPLAVRVATNSDPATIEQKINDADVKRYLAVSGHFVNNSYSAANVLLVSLRFTACAGDLVTPPCTHSWGYWKTHGPGDCAQGNNTNQWPASSLYLGTRSYSSSQLCSILLASPSGGNKLVSLAHQLIAAKFNVLRGSSTSIQSTIDAADSYIGSLVIPPVGSGSKNSSTTTESLLDTYNSQAPFHCGNE